MTRKNLFRLLAIDLAICIVWAASFEDGFALIVLVVIVALLPMVVDQLIRRVASPNRKTEPEKPRHVPMDSSGNIWFSRIIVGTFVTTIVLLVFVGPMLGEAVFLIFIIAAALFGLGMVAASVGYIVHPGGIRPVINQIRKQRKARQRQKKRDQKSLMRYQRRITKQITLGVKDQGLVLHNPAGDLMAHREGDLPEGIETIRPFAVLHADNPTRRRVEFELFDGEGEKRLEDISQWALEPGDNFVYAGKWLPLEPERDTLDEAWVMKLYVSRKLVAVHRFQRDAGGGPILAHLDGDGELSDELLDIVSDPELDRVSLDELLGE